MPSKKFIIFDHQDAYHLNAYDVLLLSVLVAFFDLSFFEEEATHHAVFVQECLHFLGLNSEECFQE